MQIILFPFDRSGWFRADVVTDAVDPSHFVNDAGRHARKDVVRKSRPVGGHEVVGVDTSDY